MKYCFPISLLLLVGCYKESTDVCTTDTLDRTLKSYYQAHWEATVNVTSNYNDTVFVYRTHPDLVALEKLDSGESGSYTFKQYEQYNVWVDAHDSLLPLVSPLVTATVTYNCP